MAPSHWRAALWAAPPLQDVLDLIETKTPTPGIIALLDEACLFPAGTFESFAQKLYTTHAKHTRFSKPKMSNTAFTLNHYAGSVRR